MKLSILVPVFNEAGTVRDVFAHLFSSTCPIEREWIVIDDASTDGTREILRELSGKHGFRLLEQEKNAGKGAAVRRGIEAAEGQVILIQDADFEYDPGDIPALIEPICNGTADVVFGSRFSKNGRQVHRTYHYLVNRVLTVLSNLMSGIYLTDMETCYKAFRADLLKAMRLRSNRFGVEVELTAYTAKTAARILELPIHYYPRTYLQGKKITWRDGVSALLHLIRFNYLISASEAFHGLPACYGSRSNLLLRAPTSHQQ